MRLLLLKGFIAAKVGLRTQLLRICAQLLRIPDATSRDSRFNFLHCNLTSNNDMETMGQRKGEQGEGQQPVEGQQPREGRIVDQTRNWIHKVVVGLNLCPFAAREMKRGSVRYRVVEGSQPEMPLEAFLEECHHLDENPATETSLLIFADAFEGFEDYLDLVEAAEQLLELEGYEGVYQVASFHPDYQFAGAPADDAANYTNRSPYPMLHLLREESIEKALEHYAGDPDDIPERNIRFTREKGLPYMKMLRDSCF